MGHFGQLYRAVRCFVFGNIVGEGQKETFGVLGGHYDAAGHLRLGHPRHMLDEVEDEFAGGVGDYRQVRVVPAGHLRTEVYVQFLLFHRQRLDHKGGDERKDCVELGEGCVDHCVCLDVVALADADYTVGADLTLTDC